MTKNRYAKYKFFVGTTKTKINIDSEIRKCACAYVCGAALDTCVRHRWFDAFSNKPHRNYRLCHRCWTFMNAHYDGLRWAQALKHRWILHFLKHIKFNVFLNSAIQLLFEFSLWIPAMKKESNSQVSTESRTQQIANIPWKWISFILLKTPENA